MRAALSPRPETMDYKVYYQTVEQMEQAGVSREYIQGWIGGFMGNPRREEQRVTEAYEAGYADGESGSRDGWEPWVGR